jgi:DNA-binding NarL/FixJ family response regulator
LVLLDLAMPEMNGAEAASVLKMTTPDVRIILFTMHSENVGRYLKSALGVDAVLSKPEGITFLVKAIDAALSPMSGPLETGKPAVEPSVTLFLLADRNKGESETKV